MENSEIDRIVNSLYRYIEVGLYAEDGHAHYWAVETLNRLFSKSEPELSEQGKTEQYDMAWKIIIRMLELASKRKQLTLVSYELDRLIQLNPKYFLVRIAESVKHSPRLSYAISHIYTTDTELREQLRSLGCSWAVLGFEDEIEERLLEHLKPVVEDWLVSVLKPHPEQDEISWAARAIDDDAFAHPDRCWRAILQIAAECSSKRQLRCLRHHLATLLSGASSSRYLEVAASVLESNRRLAYVVSKLKTTSLARDGGWLELWAGIIERSEQTLLDKPLTSRELRVAKCENRL